MPMRDVRIVDGEVVTLPDDPACWSPFARLAVLHRRELIARYGEGGHTHACDAATAFNLAAVREAETECHAEERADG